MATALKNYLFNRDRNISIVTHCKCIHIKGFISLKKIKLPNKILMHLHT